MARLRSIIITNGGTGYSSPPSVVFNGISGQTVAPVATATIFGGSVTDITIDTAGAFSSGPTSITLSGGGGTAAAAVPYSEDPRLEFMMTLDLVDHVFNRGALRPQLGGLTGHREFDNAWRNALGTLELDTTASPRRPTQTIIPGISGS